MFWKFFLLEFIAFTSSFEINVLHKPKVHKSFGEGSYVFNQPYKHGLEGKYHLPLICNNALCIVIAEERESMGYGYYQFNNGDPVSAPEYHQDEESKNESLPKYNDPILDEFLAYLQKLYFDSQEETVARSFSVSSVKI